MFEEVNLVTATETIPLIVPELTPHNPPAVRGYRMSSRNTLLGAPSTLFSDRERVAIAGAKMRPLAHSARTIALPVTVWTNNPNELPEAVDHLLSAVDPATQSIVTIETKRTGAVDYRRIKGWVIGGMDAVEYGSKDSRIARIPLIFKCPDPYWEIGEPQVSAPFLISGGFTSPPLGTITIPIVSEIPAWPKWDISIFKEAPLGFGDAFEAAHYRITNTTTGDMIEQRFFGDHPQGVQVVDIGDIDVTIDGTPATRTVEVTKDEFVGDTGLLGVITPFAATNTFTFESLPTPGFASVSHGMTFLATATPKVLTC